MRLRAFVVAAIASPVLLSGVWALARQDDGEGPERPPGVLIRADDSGAIEAAAGDLIQIPVNFPVIPGQMARNLRVQITGEAVRNVVVVGTVRTEQGRPVIGVQELSAFLLADRPGEATVRITPINQEGPREPIDYRVKVSEDRLEPGQP